MHIVRSDKNGDTTVVTLPEMRAELAGISKIYDPEVRAVENVTVLLFDWENGADDNEIALVVGDLTFTMRTSPVVTKPDGDTRDPACDQCCHTPGEHTPKDDQ